MSTRYPHRSATSGAITLNSARKGGNTLGFWFFINLGRASCGRDKWLEFDVRDLAKKAGQPLPQLMTSADLDACRDDTDDFEQLLQRDLQRVADFCARVDAIAILTTNSTTTS